MNDVMHAQVRQRLAHQIEDLLRSEAFEDTGQVAWALVNAVETTEVGRVAALLAEEGNGHER